MIYDCFTFFNELDLLEIRLNVLNDVVDKFVLVEMTKTHSGQDKPLYYKENKNRFKKFHDKIIHIIVDDCPESDDSWVPENYQRNCIAKGLEGCKPDDVIMISDLDEIPNPKIIKKLDCKENIYLLEQNMYYYFVNYLDVSQPLWSIGTKVLSYKNFLHGLDKVDVPYSTYLPESLNHGTTASKIRMWFGAKTIQNGGWHFSYLGGVDAIIKKIKSFSHQEFNKPEYTDRDMIIKRIASGKDLFNRSGHFYKAVPLNKSFPEYLLNNQKKYSNLIYQMSWKDKFKFYFKKGIHDTKNFIFCKKRETNGQKKIYIFGIKVLSYKRK